MDLLFAHGDDGTPILDGAADPRTAAGQARPIAQREEPFLADVTAGASDLARQGWAIVAPASAEGARLEALVQRLVAARAEDQQAEVQTIRVPPAMDGAAASAWKREVYPALYGDDEARRPRYLLVLGDLDQVSLETQQVLAQDGLLGRLACAGDDGYAAYADKVVAWQRAPSADRARAMFYTVHDGTPATAAGHAKLIRPCHERCARAAGEPRGFPATLALHGADAPDPGELLALAAARSPSVLLSMSHGLGPPRRRPWSPAEARAEQGAMSFGAEGAIRAGEVGSAAFLPGGLWIYFACFGAGTPRTSAYHHWLELLARHGMAELGGLAALRGLDPGGGFVSGLAKAALGNPDGPLAVLGHVDLAWSYSYEELRVAGGDGSDGGGGGRDGGGGGRDGASGGGRDGGSGSGGAADQRITGSNRALNFYQLIAKLVAGERAGAAMLAMRRVLDAVGAELTEHYDRCAAQGSLADAAPGDALALGHLWMLHQDLRGYALLGDPAVRLPVAHAVRDAHPAPGSRAAHDVRAADEARATHDVRAADEASPPAVAPMSPGGATQPERSGQPEQAQQPGQPEQAQQPGQPEQAQQPGRPEQIDQLERAALAIAGGDSPGVLAAQLGVPRSELVEAAAIYRNAGRAALAALLAARATNDADNNATAASGPGPESSR
ncbi:MAG TPA: hypothetical protein VH165_34335 [Kofleriaceae bacterium]|jgi:hypothetical protein|nr:hypothetical protein [Kofleriaceae bacterium]